MMERHIKGGQKTIAYKQLGLSMDIETKVVQHVPRNRTCQPDNLKPCTPIPSLKTLFSLFFSQFPRCLSYLLASRLECLVVCPDLLSMMCSRIFYKSIATFNKRLSNHDISVWSWHILVFLGFYLGWDIFISEKNTLYNIIWKILTQNGDAKKGKCCPH